MKVVPATLRDTSYVLYHLNPLDEEELACQVDPGLRRDHLAYGMLMSGDSFAVRDKANRPIAIFGTAPINRYCLSVWALGTKEMPKAAGLIGRYICDEHLPGKIADGYNSMEARSHANHAVAHRWMRSWGAKQHGGPFVYGGARDMFLLFRWTVDDIGSVRRTRRLRANRN